MADVDTVIITTDPTHTRALKIVVNDPSRLPGWGAAVFLGRVALAGSGTNGGMQRCPHAVIVSRSAALPCQAMCRSPHACPTTL